MDIIEFIVFLTVLIVVINIIKVFYFDIYVDLIKVNMFGTKAFFFPNKLVSFVRGSITVFSNVTIKFALIFIVFYIIFYLIYIIIVHILIPALIIFQPLFELILKIPPFPQLIKYGVFTLFDRLISAFAIKGFILYWLETYLALFLFSYDNIAVIFNYIFPGLGDKIVEAIKYDKEKKNNPNEIIEIEDENKKEEDEQERREQENLEKAEKEEKEGLKKRIEQETNICYAMNMVKITPNMSEYEKNMAEFTNSQMKIKCISESSTKYLKI
jgi:hypothetical protein